MCCCSLSSMWQYCTVLVLTLRLWANSAMPLTSQSVCIDSDKHWQQTTDEKIQGLWTAGATGETEGQAAGITGAK